MKTTQILIQECPFKIIILGQNDSQPTVGCHMDMAKNFGILFSKWTLAILSACFES